MELKKLVTLWLPPTVVTCGEEGLEKDGMGLKRGDVDR